MSLNGVLTSVRWSDGDSFHILDGPHKGKNTRLTGYNTLENFGPVHHRGTWTATELFVIAKQAGTLAASKSWVCTSSESIDGYRRLLVNCPDLTSFLVSQGVALVYSVEAPQESALAAHQELLAVQQRTMEAKIGMWKNGIVRGVVTSVHSFDEEKLEGGAYNRVVDTETGLAVKRPHNKNYSSCEVVCEETAKQQSCLTYVPFKQRYKNKPTCLK